MCEMFNNKAVSTTVKGLRLYHTYKLTSCPVTVSFINTGRRPETLRSENKDFITYRTESYMSISIFESVPLASES